MELINNIAALMIVGMLYSFLRGWREIVSEIKFNRQMKNRYRNAPRATQRN